MNVILLLLADALLILAGIVYGVKFLRKRNYLCGVEWLIMAISGTNFFLWALFGWDFGYDAAHFFDAFSRSFGFPVVAVAGMMVVTHNYQPSRLADALYFLLGFVGAAVLVAADHSAAFAVYKPPFYLLT
jgi:putative Mn2+ efflux pump MntP